VLLQLQESESSVLISTFFIGETLWGIDTLRVQEVIRVSDVTPVRHAAPSVAGVINLRGKIVTIVDLGKKLALPQATSAAETRIIIVEWNNEYVGLLVDGVSDVVNAEISQIAPAPSNVQGVQGSFLEGVLRTRESLISILGIDKILADADG